MKKQDKQFMVVALAGMAGILWMWNRKVTRLTDQLQDAINKNKQG